MRHRDAAYLSTLARWIAARPLGAHVERLAGARLRARLVGVATADAGDHQLALDPDAAHAEVRVGGAGFVVAGAARGVRALTQRLLGGPAELDAPRPLTAAEQAIWALAIAAAIEDTGVAAEVWPRPLAELARHELADRQAIELVIEADTPTAVAPMTVIALVPRDLPLRVPPARPWPALSLDVPVILGACALPRAVLRRLAVRDVITVEGGLALVVGDGTISLSAAPGAVEAEVVTGYVPRAMALPDEAHLELTVQLGTTRLSLRELGELAPGQIVPLGRPLAGPFEVRAAGQLLGQGELVDIDGELGVRIVSLQESH